MQGFSMKVPFTKGRLVWAPTDGNGSAITLGDQVFATNLQAEHYRDGKLYNTYDLGSGLVTNVGVTALANDFAWAANCQTLKLSNYHATGTGTTAAAATDIQLQTAAGPSPVTGTQSLSTAANTQIYRTSATINYTSSLAITEWGLFTAGTLSSATGSPFTATSANSATVTGTPYTASSSTVQGEQQYIVVSGSVYSLILSNTTSVLTLANWYSTTTGAAASPPTSTATFTIQPVMWDHKVFAALNVVNGDALTFNYYLTINSGG